MTDDQDDAKSAAETEQNAIRGAFLSRQTQATTASAGGGEADPAALALRGVYLNRLTAEARRGTGTVAGSEDSGDVALRSAYAARSTPVAAPAARPPVRKAAAKKVATKAAKKAAPKKAAKRAAPKKKRAAAPALSKRKAAPVRRAKAKMKAKAKTKTGKRRR
jgi:hypothetical protein